MVIERSKASSHTNGNRQLEAFFQRAGIVIEPVTIEQGVLARQAFFGFSKGRYQATPCRAEFWRLFRLCIGQSNEPLAVPWLSLGCSRGRISRERTSARRCHDLSTADCRAKRPLAVFVF